MTTSWRVAAQATLHCLTGCAIGEVLGMVIGTATGLHNAGTVALSIALAFVFGYGLTMSSVLRHGVGLRAALGVALAADTVSILVMELVDNAVVVAVPGALNAGLDTLLFWGSLAVSLVIAFLVTTPVNRALISRGRGHAVVHAYHGGGASPDGSHQHLPAQPAHGHTGHAGASPDGSRQHLPAQPAHGHTGHAGASPAGGQHRDTGHDG